MTIVEGSQRRYEPMVGDPDDHRPETTWALVVDPERSDALYVKDAVVLFENCAPGDAIPLHTHPQDEVVVIEAGRGESRVGDERAEIGPGSVVFIPRGRPHGTRNSGTEPLKLIAFFASSAIGIEYLERNPAPGTEGDPPQPPFAIDLRAPQ